MDNVGRMFTRYTRLRFHFRLCGSIWAFKSGSLLAFRRKNIVIFLHEQIVLSTCKSDPIMCHLRSLRQRLRCTNDATSAGVEVIAIYLPSFFIRTPGYNIKIICFSGPNKPPQRTKFFCTYYPALTKQTGSCSSKKLIICAARSRSYSKSIFDSIQFISNFDTITQPCTLNFSPKHLYMSVYFSNIPRGMLGCMTKFTWALQFALN